VWYLWPVGSISADRSRQGKRTSAAVGNPALMGVVPEPVTENGNSHAGLVPIENARVREQLVAHVPKLPLAPQCRR
jgi:hypothetical protein